MKEPFYFLIIFGTLLVAASLYLHFSDDPRGSVFFARVRGDLTKQEAKDTARKMSIGLFITGTAVIVICTLCLLMLF